MPAVARAIIAMLTQNITRHPTRCVSAPPNSGPMLKPSMRNPVHAPIAAARRSGGMTVPSAANVLGTASAEAKPCKARPVSSMAPLAESAMMADAAANSMRPTIATRRAPKRSEASPPSTMQSGDDEIGVHRPLHVRRAKGEVVGAHRRQCRHDGGPVDADGERRHARRPQHRADAGLPVWRWLRRRRCRHAFRSR